MLFDWPNFLQTNNVHFATSGPNCSKGNLVTHCPWCGNNDEGQHLVVNLSGKGFKCWRDRSHAGKNPAKLIQALLNCSWEQANSIAGQSKSLPNDFMNKVKQSLSKQEIVVKPNNLKLSKEFKMFSKLPSCKIYLDYIVSRGFTIKDAEEYNILYASQGRYKGRIIFPIMFEGKLVGWTGRTVYLSQNARYKTLTNDADKAKDNDETPAPAPISDFLLFYDQLVKTDASTIVLCEGPFDAWKINILGKYLGVCATCFFTSSVSKQQVNLLHGLLPKFQNKLLLLDQNTFSKATRIGKDLLALDVVVKKLPGSISDPGEIKSVNELKQCLQLYK